MPTMTEDDNKPGDNEEIVIVEDQPNGNQNQDDDGHDDDARLSGNDDDGHQDDGNDAEREAIRERRRKEKAERKQRREEAISRDKLELQFLRKRNDDLERRLGGVEQRAHQADLSQIDAQIAQARNEAEMAERVIAKAVAAGNGDDVTQAMRYRDQAIQKAQQLAYAKQQAAQQRPVKQDDGLDDLAVHYAKEFISENPWYDVKGGDEDSAIVLAIDGALHREGFRPDTEEYWDELRERAARRIPERFKPAGSAQGNQRQQSQQPQRQQRGGPAIGSGREHAPTSTRTEVYISPERKQALVDAGVWDDPVLRMKYVKRYAEYDRNNRA
ncbi:MAG: hypothetical protein RL758_235 [Pseudomonadota bacterium]